MIPKVSRRQALGILAAPIVVGCRGLDLTGPGFSAAAATNGRITLIGAGDQHAITGLLRSYREKTAAMVKAVLDADPTAWAFNAGDLTHKGSALELQDAYQSSWGQFRQRTLFTLGNHDRMTDPTGATFFNYTGAQKYYARTLGSWRIYVLCCESPEFGGVNPLEQTAWLKADIAKYSSTHHIMAMWHYPLYSNICAHAGKAMTWPGRVGPWWQVLQEHGAEFLVTGHVHRYERFYRVLRTGLRTCVRSEQGIRQFVMGTGGGSLYGVLAMDPNCERVIVTRGVTRFDLYPDRYEWSFTDTNGVVQDSGSQRCRKVLVV